MRTISICMIMNVISYSYLLWNMLASIGRVSSKSISQDSAAACMLHY